MGLDNADAAHQTFVPRSRRRNLRDDDDEDYQVKPNVKRSRRIITSEEAKQADEESEEANLQAEKEDLEDEEDEDYDWSKRHAVSPRPAAFLPRLALLYDSMACF